MDTPLISIIMPTLNSGKFLSESLKSVTGQTYKNYEVIIVDGGSVDETKSIANQFEKITFFDQTDKGLAAAWNAGIKMANGNYIAFLDSDDWWDCNCLSNHVETLQKSPQAICSIGHLQFFLDDPNSPPPGFKTSLLNKSHLGYMPGCFVGKKEVFDRIGLFETIWDIVSDIVWFAKLKNNIKEIRIVDNVVLHKRVHGKNLSYTTAQTPIYQKELLKILHGAMKK